MCVCVHVRMCVYYMWVCVYLLDEFIRIVIWIEEVIQGKNGWLSQESMHLL